jgi:hypothetical protein
MWKSKQTKTGIVLGLMLTGAALLGGRLVAPAARADDSCGQGDYWLEYGGDTWSCDGTALDGQGDTGGLALSNTVLGDFDLSANVQSGGPADIAFRFNEGVGGYILRDLPAGDPDQGLPPGLYLVSEEDGQQTTVTPITATSSSETIAVKGRGEQISVSVNGQVVDTFTDATFGTGRVGFGTEDTGSLDSAEFSQISVGNGLRTVASSKTVPCFNGTAFYPQFGCQ